MKILTMIAAASVAVLAVAEQTASGEARSTGRLGRPPTNERMPRGPMGGMGAVQDPILRAAMNPRIAEKVGITDEQKAKLGDSAELRAKSRELQEKVRAGMKRQMDLLQAEKVDEAAVMAAIDEVFETRKALAKEQTKRVIALRAILTPEQVAKIREEINNERARRSKARVEKAAPPEKSNAPKGE